MGRRSRVSECDHLDSLMAVWRTKAYELFKLRPGAYSFAHGKRDLFADLVDLARESVRDGNTQTLDLIIEYVTWAATQKSDDLASVVDLAFFLPVFRDPLLCARLKRHVPESLFAEKWELLMEPTE